MFCALHPQWLILVHPHECGEHHGQKDTVEKIGFMRYADAVAFRALAAECRWSGVLVEAVEAALSAEVAV